MRLALRNALMPIINKHVSGGRLAARNDDRPNPGRSDTRDAVRYQILIMFLIAAGTGIGAMAAVTAASYRLTDSRHRLRLDRLAPERG